MSPCFSQGACQLLITIEMHYSPFDTITACMRDGSIASAFFHAFVYARRGRKFMGWKSPVCESHCHLRMVVQALADGKGYSDPHPKGKMSCPPLPRSITW